MAEVFGIATGVLQVAGFGAAVGGTLLKCAREIRNANKELETIAVQVGATSKSLDAVGALLKDPETKDFHTPKLYEDTNAVSKGCHDVFCELENAVNQFQTKSGKSRYQLTLTARLQWPLSSARLMDLQKVLKHYSDVLHLMLAVLQIVEGRRAATKDELRGLEVQLRTLVISNNSLSEANKSLTDTIAAITQQPYDLKSPPMLNLMSLGPGLNAPHSQTDRRPSASSGQTLNPAMPETSVPGDPMVDLLQHCMDTVQELATSISCAMDAWQGQTKLGSSDIHGMLAKVTAQFGELPRRLRCKYCMRNPTWSELGSTGDLVDSKDACACLTTPSSALENVVDGSGRRLASTLPCAVDYAVDYDELKTSRESLNSSDCPSPSAPTSITWPIEAPPDSSFPSPLSACDVHRYQNQPSGSSKPQRELDDYRRPQWMERGRNDELDQARIDAKEIDQDALDQEALFDEVEQELLRRGSPARLPLEASTMNRQSYSHVTYSTDDRSYCDDSKPEAAAGLDKSCVNGRLEAISDLCTPRPSSDWHGVTSCNAQQYDPPPIQFSHRVGHGTNHTPSDLSSRSPRDSSESYLGSISRKTGSSSSGPHPIALTPAYSARKSSSVTHHHGAMSSTASYQQSSRPISANRPSTVPANSPDGICDDPESRSSSAESEDSKESEEHRHHRRHRKRDSHALMRQAALRSSSTTHIDTRGHLEATKQASSLEDNMFSSDRIKCDLPPRPALQLPPPPPKVAEPDPQPSMSATGVPSGKSGVNTFLGAGGGALIGDMIFPGLGTIGGTLIGGIGGHEYCKPRKQRHRERSPVSSGKRFRRYSYDDARPDIRTSGLAGHDRQSAHVSSWSPSRVQHLGSKRPRSPVAEDGQNGTKLQSADTGSSLPTPASKTLSTPDEDSVPIPEASDSPASKRRREEIAQPEDVTSALHSLLGRWVGEAKTLVLSQSEVEMAG